MVIEKVERPSQAVEIWGRVAAETGRCRSCGVTASRVHSRYRRHLGDTSIAGQPVVIHLTVRRFFCSAVGCSRRTFAEQVPGLTIRYGVPLRTLPRTIALALGVRARGRTCGPSVWPVRPWPRSASESAPSRLAYGQKEALRRSR